MNKKNIYIFYCSYGNGHKSAAEAIYESLDKEKNNVYIVDAMKYVDKFFDSLIKGSWDLLRIQSPTILKTLYYPTDKSRISNTVVKKHSELYSKKLFKLFEDKMPDEIICTHFMPSFMISKLIKKGKITPRLSVVITDYIVHSFWIINHEYVNYYFTACPEATKEVLEAGVDRGKVITTGIPIKKDFSKLQIDDLDSIYEKLNLPRNKKMIMFFVKLEKSKNSIDALKLLEALVNTLDNYHFICFTGNDDQLYEKVEDIFTSKDKSNMTLIKFSNEIAKIMRVSSAIFTKAGGLTTSEALASGLPMFIINPTPGQEEGNTDFIEKNKAGVLVKKDNIEEIIGNLKSNEKYLPNLAANAKNVGQPNSTIEILKFLKLK